MGLRHGMTRFALSRRLVANRRVTALSAIEHRGILEDALCRPSPRHVLPMAHKLTLQRPEIDFNAGSVPAIAFAAGTSAAPLDAPQPGGPVRRALARRLEWHRCGDCPSGACGL